MTRAKKNVRRKEGIDPLGDEASTVLKTALTTMQDHLGRLSKRVLLLQSNVSQNQYKKLTRKKRRRRPDRHAAPHVTSHARTRKHAHPTPAVASQTSSNTTQSLHQTVVHCRARFHDRRNQPCDVQSCFGLSNLLLCFHRPSLHLITQHSSRNRSTGRRTD